MYQCEKITPQPAPGSEQGVAAVEQGFDVGVITQNAHLLPFADDIAPEVLAWIEQKEMHFNHRRNRLQHLPVAAGQRGDAKHKQPFGKIGQTFRMGLHQLFQLLQQARTVIQRMTKSGAVGHQRPPHQRLPRMGRYLSIGDFILAQFPAQQPVRAIHQILVKHVGNGLRQLIALNAIGIVLQVMSNGLTTLFQRQLW